MSVWPVTGWQVVCDHAGCTVTGPRRWEWAEALADWITYGGLAVDPPRGIIPGRGSAARQHLTLCHAHAVTVCARCGTGDDLVVTDLDARRSWCAEHWAEVTGADLTAGKTPRVYAHQTDPGRPGDGQPDTKSEGITS